MADDFYFSVNIDDERTLCIAPLTDRKLALADESIEDASGYFLYERKGIGDVASIEVIAKVLSEDAALRLRDMFSMT